MDVNIALLPAFELNLAVVSLSERLQTDLGSTLVLSREDCPLAHVTLYLSGFEEHNLLMAPPLIAWSIAEIYTPDIAVTGVSVSAQGSVMLNVEKTKELEHLHRWMIHKLNPLRVGAKPQIWEARRERYGPYELARLENNGFPQSLEAWSPHFTIGRVPRKQAGEAKALLGTVKLAGKARCIGIGTVGEHGTLTKVLAEAKFGL